MKSGKQKSNWLVDSILFTGFLISFFLELTGIPLHQWLGIFIGAFCGYHLLAHWTWIKTVTQRYFGRTSGQARLFYLMDASLLLGLIFIIGSGLVISTWLNLTLENYASWKNLHVLVSLATLALLVLKIGLHWRWIVMTTRRSIFSPSKSFAINKQSFQPARVPAITGRRDFLKLMGVVGAAAVIAASSALKDGSLAAESGSSSAQEELNNDDSTYSTSVIGQDNVRTSVAQNSTATSCIQRCNRGCSYPGHCHRYTDSNDNGLCDLGECI